MSSIFLIVRKRGQLEFGPFDSGISIASLLFLVYGFGPERLQTLV